jgi:hypothetical protein
MSFIRFSNRIMNPAWIQSIECMPNAYKIIMSNPHTDGWMLFSSGSIHSTNKPLWIDKDKHPSDYQLMTTWIQKNSTA